LVRKTTQDKRDDEEQERERSLSEDWWKTKIGEMRRLVENEYGSPEGTTFRRMNGAKQKSSEKSKYGSEKVV